jgi:hypothetical protein
VSDNQLINSAPAGTLNLAPASTVNRVPTGTVHSRAPQDTADNQTRCMIKPARQEPALLSPPPQQPGNTVVPKKRPTTPADPWFGRTIRVY